MHIAEEIMQEVLLRLWQNRESVEVDNLGGWLYRVASNLAYSYLKREALNGRLLSSLKKKQANQFSEIDQQMDYKECNELIHKALSQLPDQQRKVYQLSLQEGMSRKKVAELLNISPNTVKNHLTRALQSLRHFLLHANILMAFFF
jgi:RNA polymerase sigma-70 factor (ECF subfamily)